MPRMSEVDLAHQRSIVFRRGAAAAVLAVKARDAQLALVRRLDPHMEGDRTTLDKLASVILAMACMVLFTGCGSPPAPRPVAAPTPAPVADVPADDVPAVEVVDEDAPVKPPAPPPGMDFTPDAPANAWTPTERAPRPAPMRKVAVVKATPPPEPYPVQVQDDTGPTSTHTALFQRAMNRRDDAAAHRAQRDHARRVWDATHPR